jgi:hypothetical protein
VYSCQYRGIWKAGGLSIATSMEPPMEPKRRLCDVEIAGVGSWERLGSEGAFESFPGLSSESPSYDLSQSLMDKT